MPSKKETMNPFASTTRSNRGGFRINHSSLTEINLDDLAALGWHDDVRVSSIAVTKPQRASNRYWCTRQKPLTAVQEASRHTLVRWFRYVVPAMKRLHKYRTAVSFIANTRRRVVCSRQLEQWKWATGTLQGFVRMVVVRATYQQARRAILALQRFYRQHYSNGLLARLRVLIRHRNLLMKHTTLARQLHTAKRDIACCNRELANIRNSRDWTLCPITREAIDEPVINCVDGHLYEKEALEEWLKRDLISPLTRATMHRNDVWSLKDFRSLYKYISSFSNCFDNNPQRVQAVMRQCNSLKCDNCSRVFHRETYHSQTQMFSALVQHQKDVHGITYE